MMNKTTQQLKKLALVVTMAGLSASLQAVDFDATATANVVAPLTVTENTALDFGDIGATASAGSVTISTAGARSSTNVTEFATDTGNAADITGDGFGNSTFTLSFTGGTLSDGSGNTMAVGTFTHNAGATPTLSGGTLNFQVGATLTVGANQTANAYTTAPASGGTPYVITVNYN